MGASRTCLRGSGVARAEASRFARAGFLTLIFLVAGIPGSFADHLSYPTDSAFCAAFVRKAICEGAGAQLSSDMCDTTTAYGCSWDVSTKCRMSTDDSTAFDNVLSGWFPAVDTGSACNGLTGTDCSPNNGCDLYGGTCYPFPKTGVSLLSADGASNVIQAYYHSIRQSQYCMTAGVDGCADQAGCRVVDWGSGDECQHAAEFDVWDVVKACEAANFAFTPEEKDSIAVATYKNNWAALEEYISYPGLVGCALACEGSDVDQTRCASKPYYCHWSTEWNRCESAVGAEPCPESVPTARWLPVSYKSDANRLAEAFFESENAIVRVDWKGVPLAYLRVTRDVATFAVDLHDRLFVQWLDTNTTTHAALNVDFELYSTYEDALARSKKARWTHCANVTDAPFPGGCAPDANSAPAYESLRLSADSPTDHAVFVESPAPVAFGDAFAPPLDSNQAQFTGSNAISAAGDLSLGGADAFTIRTRADLVDSYHANLLDIPGLLSITTTTVATTNDNNFNNFILRFTGLCDLSSPIVADGTTLGAPAFSGSTEIVVTYDGSYVNLYVDGEQWYSGELFELNGGESCAHPGVPSLADARWSMGNASNSFDDTGTYVTKGFLSFLTTWSGVALSPQNVKRMSRADYRYIPRPTHHFNFDEGAGSVVRDHFRGVGGADTLRAYFGPTPAYRKAPAAPSLSTFLKATAGVASVAVAKSKSYAHIYEGSFTMQAWFRADGDLTAGSYHQVFGNYFSDTLSSSAGGFFNLTAQPGTSSEFYGLTLEYTSDGMDVSESVLDGDALEIDRWYHLAVQRDVEAGEARVFVDGVLKLSSTDVGYPALGLDGALVDDADAGLFLGGNAKDGVATKASFSDFQVYSAAVPPTFPTGPGVCSPPSAEFLVLWLPLDRAGDQVDASGRGAAATAPADFVETTASAPAIDAYTRPPSTPSDAPCGRWGVYDGCAAIEPEACSACLASAGFDTGECGMKAVGGAVTFEGGFTVHTFTRNGTFEVLRDDLASLEVLVVGGGGGGGAVVGEVGGAGGGAGGAVAADVIVVSSGDAFDVVVGAGGAGASGAVAGASGAVSGASGAQSAFGSLAADGGAGGASVATTAAAAGGAGAMRAGWTMGNATTNWRAFAGAAVVSSASGASRAYAGGGGACVWDHGCSAGSATGGDASFACAAWRCDAHQNSGGGGGAAATGPAGRGADGVVIVRYQ